MGAYYIGPRLWPAEPLLKRIHQGGETVVVFMSAHENRPSTLELLPKILAAVNLSSADSTWWTAQAPLSWGRLQVMPGRHFWVFGAALLPVAVGLYDRQGQRLSAPTAADSIVWRLPSLSEMIQNPEAKKDAWRWLRLLTSRS